MRRLIASIAAVLLAGCCFLELAQALPQPTGSGPSVVSTAQSADSAREFLMNSAAGDFHAQTQGRPSEFRHVRFGHLSDAANGKDQYLLCGEYSAAPAGEAAKWIPFVTIKTSGYEQYVGTQAQSLCDRPTIQWNKEDLTATLQKRWSALEK